MATPPSKMLNPDLKMKLRLPEYQLFLGTESLTRQKIIAEKNYFNKTYLDYVEEISTSDLLISSFQAKEGMEETIIRWLEKICLLNKGLQIILNNYSCIPEHEIFLRIQNINAVQQFINQVKMVDSFIISANCPKPQFNYNPSIPIAENLKPPIYYLAIKEYCKKLFYASFEVRSLILMKRNSPYDLFKVIHRFAVPQYTLTRN